MVTEHSTATTSTDGPTTDPPPCGTFRDGDGRRLVLDSRRPAAGEPETLAAFYNGIGADGRAQGIPPASSERRESWLTDLLVNATVDTVVRDGYPVVGHATLVAGSPTQPHELTVFVDADYRSAGVGSELLSVLLDAGRAVGVEAVELTVEHENRAAQRLYQQHGFEVVDRGPFVLEMRRGI